MGKNAWTLARTGLALGRLGGLGLLAGCGGALGSAHLAPSVPVDSAGAERCRVAARQERPLVTEWAASEKADLEGRLSSGQVVAVRYTGCELQVVDSCRLAGRYAFRRTTLSTDTVEIGDADELYAKLPVGAVGLEGELERSGRLAVRTTVAGEFRLEAPPASAQDAPGCGEATHVVSAVSVGAFSLLAGGAVKVGGSVDAHVGKVGGSARREESTVRQAGDDRACRDATDTAPSAMCASPLQVFLSRLGGAEPRDDGKAAAELAERRARASGVLIDIPAPRDPMERWSLRDADGRALCDLPCSRWVAPRSGYYVERAPSDARDGVRIDLPNDLPAPGAHVTADYGPEKGMPFLSKLTFYGVGLPTGALAVGLAIAGAVDTKSDFSGFFLGSSLFYAAAAAGCTWWFLYSDDKHFRLKSAQDGGDGAHVAVVPGGIVGNF